jgi:glucose-1-phosphate thymidylyltransferase
MKGLILAAGYATRLYPLTRDTPKPLLEVGGRPMVDYALDALRTIAELDHVYLVTNARFAQQFRDWAPEGVTVVDDGTGSDEDRLGAIGDIGYVLDTTGLDDDLAVIAGDNLFTADISGFAAVGLARDAPAIATHDMGADADMTQYNVIEFDDEGRVTHFEEKPRNATSTMSGVALYFYPRRALPLIRQYLAEGNNPDQPGRLVQWIYPRTPVYVWELPGEWYDIGAREQLDAARAEFAAK